MNKATCKECGYTGGHEGSCSRHAANTARIRAAANDLFDSLMEIIHYDGGADNALQDEYVMQRAEAALWKATNPIRANTAAGATHEPHCAWIDGSECDCFGVKITTKPAD